MILRSLLLVGVMMAGCATMAQQVGGVRHLYPERLIEDIELLRAAIHEAHPDPYRYRTRSEVDAIIDSVVTTLHVPMSVVEFNSALHPILQAVGDSHCTTEWPNDVRDRLKSEALLIPMQVRILPDGLYVEGELKGFRSIPLGSRILSINGMEVDRILETLISTVITDGANRTYAERVVEREFPERYHLYVENASRFDVLFVDVDGVQYQRTIFAISALDMERSRKPNISLKPWSSVWDGERGTMWVTMRSMDEDTLLRYEQKPDRFIDALLTELKKVKAEFVVLDLRGAGGRELAMAELVFSAFAKEPFTMLSDMFARSINTPEERASHHYPTEYYASTDVRFLQEAQGGIYRVPKNDPRLVPAVPLAKAFQGKVYIICDGFTRDAGAAMVMMARRTGRAKVFGEEVGSNSSGFTGGPQWVVNAPNSGLEFHIPLLMYVPDGRGVGPKDRGEQPNNPAYQTPDAMARGVDSVIRSMEQMIEVFR